mmetsp:Transcript_11874/g.27475  ORF Transcript_11874/g.27475 Transcript_11874/m.27475 type:complete len:211 (+) Transcript_11874:791-1423(+)
MCTRRSSRCLLVHPSLRSARSRPRSMRARRTPPDSSSSPTSSTSAETIARPSSCCRTRARRTTAIPMSRRSISTTWAASTIACAGTLPLVSTSQGRCRRTSLSTRRKTTRVEPRCLRSVVIGVARWSTIGGCSFSSPRGPSRPSTASRWRCCCCTGSRGCGCASARRAWRCTCSSKRSSASKKRGAAPPSMRWSVSVRRGGSCCLHAATV